MREVVVSAATLAGLVGLACLYGNGKGIGRSRVAREADFEAINDVNYDVLGDNLPGEMSESDLAEAELNFIRALGYLDGSVDVPEFLSEDVKVFQQNGAKKAVQFVAKCMKNNECKTNAIRKVKNWSYDQWNFLKSDDNRPSFMKPFVKELLPIKTQDYDWTADIKAMYKAEKDKSLKQAWGETLAFEACTPYDNMLWRCPPDQDKTPEKLNQNFMWSEDAETLAQFDAEKLAAPSLLDFEASVSDSARNDYQDNAFGTFGKGVKIIYIIPNGIPIFMHDEVILDKAERNAGKTSQFRNYWDWFVAFNDKYIGIKKGVNVKNRQNTGWWFIRQDEVGLPYTKSIVKASKRFPWSRFETRLVVPQYTAVAPKVTTTYRTIESAMFGADKESIPIDMRIPSEASKDGNDCFIFWFHQYVPTDIFALNKEEHQERILKIESVCTVIHIWVGLDARNEVDFGATTRVVKYIQKILQPTLLTAEHKDQKLNGYFYVSNLSALRVDGQSEGAKLLEKVYNIVAMVKSRTRCLLAAPATNVMTEIAAYAAANARENDYFEDINFLFDDFDHVTTEGIVSTTVESMMSIDPGFNPSTAPVAWETTASNVTDPWYTTEQVEDIPSQWACCGVAADAVKYDTTKEMCCSNGQRVDVANEDECLYV